MTPIAWLGLLFLVILYFECYIDMMVDTYREQLFVIRDDLFLYAMNGSIGFDHPAYKMLRHMLNGSIRFGHRMSLLYIIIVYSGYKVIKQDESYVEGFKGAWASALDSLPVDVANHLESTRQKMHMETFKHIVFRSPVLTCMAGVLLVVALMTRAGASINRKVRSKFDSVCTPVVDNMDWSAWREATC